jgi:hypothetical protein
VNNSRTCKRPVCPQCVNLASDRCCTLHEWLVFPPRGSTEFYADAAFFTLRAHAARKPNSHNGLFFLFRCVVYERLVSLTDDPAPYRSRPLFRWDHLKTMPHS